MDPPRLEALGREWDRLGLDRRAFLRLVAGGAGAATIAAILAACGGAAPTATVAPAAPAATNPPTAPTPTTAGAVATTPTAPATSGGGQPDGGAEPHPSRGGRGPAERRAEQHAGAGRPEGRAGRPDLQPGRQDEQPAAAHRRRLLRGPASVRGRPGAEPTPGGRGDGQGLPGLGDGDRAMAAAYGVLSLLSAGVSRDGWSRSDGSRGGCSFCAFSGLRAGGSSGVDQRQGRSVWTPTCGGSSGLATLLSERPRSPRHPHVAGAAARRRPRGSSRPAFEDADEGRRQR